MTNLELVAAKRENRRSQAVPDKDAISEFGYNLAGEFRFEQPAETTTALQVIDVTWIGYVITRMSATQPSLMLYRCRVAAPPLG